MQNAQETDIVNRRLLKMIKPFLEFKVFEKKYSIQGALE